jgi:large subunit ribosomal protein L35
MPKLKTKSSCKKRFSVTASGMIKRTNKQIRNQRGTTILAPGDAGLVKVHMPYHR